MGIEPAVRPVFDRRWAIVQWILLSAIAFWAFEPAGDSWFVRDDFMLLEQADRHLEQPLEILFDRSNGYFRPLSNLTLALEWSLFGTDAAAYYAISFALQGLVALLLALLATQLSGSRAIGWLAGAAVVASSRSSTMVLWISAQPALLSTALILATVLIHARRLRPDSARPDLLVAAGAAGAVLSYEIGVAVFPLLVWIELHRSGVRVLLDRRFWLRYVPLILIGGLYVAVQGGSIEEWNSRGEFTLAQMAIAPALSLPAVFGATLWPSLVQGSSVPPGFGAFALSGLLVLTVLGDRRGWRDALLLVAISFTTLLPFALPLAAASADGGMIVDRYLYLPAIGSGLTLAFGVGRLLAIVPPVRTPLAVGIGLALAFVHGRAIHTRVPEQQQFAVVGRAALAFVEGVDELASSRPPRAGERWLVLAAPFVNAKHAGAAYRHFLDQAPVEVEQERITLERNGSPTSARTRITASLLTNRDVDRVLVYDPQRERLLEGQDATDPLVREALRFNWRRRDQPLRAAWIATLTFD